MKICIDGLHCRACVGIFDWEKEIIQDLILDVSIETMNARAPKTDSIDDTINYKTLSRILQSHVQSKHFGLIETIASDCCKLVLAFEQGATQVTIQVAKPGALSVSDSVRVIETMVRNQVVVGIGSNIEPEAHVERARAILSQEFQVVAFARNLRTKAVARPQAPDFINTAALLHTSMDKEQLTRRLKHIEWEFGRKPVEADKYGSRVIDLDILLWNQQLEDGDIYSREFLRASIEQLLPGVLAILKEQSNLEIMRK